MRDTPKRKVYQTSKLLIYFETCKSIYRSSRMNIYSMVLGLTKIEYLINIKISFNI